MKKRYNWLNHLFNFLAVILGVYLAFYVNERAKQAASKKELSLLVNAMVNDLSADIKAYEDYHVPVNQNHYQLIDSLIGLLTLGDIAGSEGLLAGTIQLENYIPNNTIYNSIKSSGKLQLIEDINIQEALSDFYDGTVMECTAKNEIQAEYLFDNVLPWLVSNTDLAVMELVHKEDLLVFKNTLIIYQTIIEQKTAHYEYIVDKAGALKEKLKLLE